MDAHVSYAQAGRLLAIETVLGEDAPLLEPVEQRPTPHELWHRTAAWGQLGTGDASGRRTMGQEPVFDTRRCPRHHLVDLSPANEISHRRAWRSLLVRLLRKPRLPAIRLSAREAAAVAEATARRAGFPGTHGHAVLARKDGAAV